MRFVRGCSKRISGLKSFHFRSSSKPHTMLTIAISALCEPLHGQRDHRCRTRVHDDDVTHVAPMETPLMDPLSRRQMLAATAAGSLLTTTALAQAQSGGAIPQPQRPGRGGSDPGPRNLARDQQNPDILVPPSTDHGSLPNLRF